MPGVSTALQIMRPACAGMDTRGMDSTSASAASNGPATHFMKLNIG
jgi:hypothetical protein